MSKWEELAAKILKKEEAKEKKCNLVMCIAGTILVIAAIAGIAYAVYRFVKKDDFDEYEDDFEDEFDYDDDFFDEEDDFEEVVEEDAETEEVAVEEVAEDVVDDTVE